MNLVFASQVMHTPNCLVFTHTAHLLNAEIVRTSSESAAENLQKAEKDGSSPHLTSSVPVFVVVTKIDMSPPNVLQETLKLLVKILKSPGCRKVPVMVKSADDVVISATNFVSERLCPIFQAKKFIMTINPIVTISSQQFFGGDFKFKKFLGMIH